MVYGNGLENRRGGNFTVGSNPTLSAKSGDAMLIVTGRIVARADSFDEVRAGALAHVARSRTEDGCISHGVAVDCENPLALVFFEEWRDWAALKVHFKQPESIAFVTSLRTLATASEGPHIYDAALQPSR